MTALQRVLRKALIADGLRRGLHECVKALAKADKGPGGAIAAGGARLCVLALDCDEKSYVKVVKALCAEKGVPLIEIPEAAKLGEWVGLFKLDKEQKPRSVVSTSVAVVTDFGEASEELQYLMNHLGASA
jgi:small subunit ribosomal protein S12e